MMPVLAMAKMKRMPDVDAGDLHGHHRAGDFAGPREHLIEVVPVQAACERDDGKGRDRRNERDDWTRGEQELVRLGRNEVLFEDELHGVRQGVQQTEEHDLAAVADDHAVHGVADAEQDRRSPEADQRSGQGGGRERERIAAFDRNEGQREERKDRHDARQRGEAPDRKARAIDEAHRRGRQGDSGATRPEPILNHGALPPLGPNDDRSKGAYGDHEDDQHLHQRRDDEKRRGHCAASAASTRP